MTKTQTPAEDTITLRVPGRAAAFWDNTQENLTNERDALSRDIAAAYLSGQQRAHGSNGTVWVFTTTRTLARAFLATLTTAAEAEFYADDADTKGANAALTMVQRHADKGLTPHTPDGYRMADPAAQAALDAEISAHREQEQQEEHKRADNATHRNAWNTLTREEQRERTGAVLDAAAAALGLQRTDARAWIDMGTVVGSVPDGRFYMEVRRLADPAAQPALDAARETLAAAGWTITDYGTHFYATPTAPAPTAPAADYPAHNTMGRCAHRLTCRYDRPADTTGQWIHPDTDHTPCTATPEITVKWTGTVKGHHHATLTLPDGARVRITHAPRGTAYAYIGKASMGTGAPTVARANSLTALANQYAHMAGYTTTSIEEHGRPGR